MVMVRGLICGHAGSDDRRGCEPGDGLRGDGTGADREDPAGPGPASGACRGAGADSGARAAGELCAAGRAELGQAELCEEYLFEDEQRPNGHDRGEGVIVLLELLLERAAALASPHVA